MAACVTGYGIIDALGSGGTDCYNAYMRMEDQRSPFDTGTSITHSFQVNSSIQLPPGVDGSHLSKTSRMGLHVVEQACSMAGVPPGSSVAVIFSSSIPLDFQDQFYAQRHGASSRRLGPRKLIDSLPGASAALISSHYQFDGISVGLTAACATGLTAIDYAIRCVDDYDYVIVGAAESPSTTTSSIFNTLGALSNESRPFDQSRSGFVLSEGAGCLVLESEEKARARGAVTYARLHKPGVAADRGSDVAPDLDGIGALSSMRRALSAAGINAEDIDFVNAHATSTIIGDAVEYKAVRELCDAPMYSCKGMFGHLLTAAGINELIYTILFSSHGHSGFNVNLQTPIETALYLPVDPIFSKKQTITTLKNSFGFGKRCASIVVEVPNVQ